MNKAPISLKTLRKHLTPIQRRLLNSFWQHYLSTQHWPLVLEIHSRYDKKRVEPAVRGLGGSVVFEQGGHSDTARYELTIIGVMLTDNAEAYEDLIARYLEYRRDLFLTKPQKQEVASFETQEALQLV